MGKIITLEVDMHTPIHTPSVPNFIQLAKGEGKLPLSQFSESALKEIGNAWTNNLIERAKEMKEFK